MKHAEPRWLRHGSGPPIALASVVALAAVQGCGSSNATTTSGPSSSSGASSSGAGGMSSSSSTGGTGGATGTGGSTGTGGAAPPFGGAISHVGTGATVFDATPDPTGKTIYVTGVDATKGTGVLSVPADGSAMAPTTIAAGAPFVAPFGISTSTDGKTLYIADPGADGGNDAGQLFRLSSTGGAPVAIAGADDYRPRSVDVVDEGGADTIYFTGQDRANGKVGVFKIPAAGGAVTVVIEGAPFVEPGGLAVAADGTIYAARDVPNYTTGPGTYSIDAFAPGATSPSRTLGPFGTDSIAGLACDRGGELYVAFNPTVAGAQTRVDVFAPGATGNAIPVRTIPNPIPSNAPGGQSIAGISLSPPQPLPPEQVLSRRRGP